MCVRFGVIPICMYRYKCIISTMPICSALVRVILLNAGPFGAGGHIRAHSYDILFGLFVVMYTARIAPIPDSGGRAPSFVFDEQTDLEYQYANAHLRGVRVCVLHAYNVFKMYTRPGWRRNVIIVRPMEKVNTSTYAQCARPEIAPRRAAAHCEKI